MKTPFPIARLITLFVLTVISACNRSSDPPHENIVQQDVQAIQDGRPSIVAAADHGDSGLAPAEEPEWRSNFPEDVRATCQKCHGLPPPSHLPKPGWKIVLPLMRDLIHKEAPLTDEQFAGLTDYYLKHGPATFEPLPYIETSGPLLFQRRRIGSPDGSLPMVVNVNVLDLDRDGALDIVVCDVRNSAVTWLKRVDGLWMETPLARVKVPVHTAVFDFDNDGDLDIVVADLGNLLPAEELSGQAILLINGGDQTFEKRVLLSGVARIADVEPADFDGDGDLDFAIGMFGWRSTGSIGWLEQATGGEFKYHNLFSMPGTIHTPVGDLDGDGRPDFVALVSQHHEQVLAFLNEGKGRFRVETLFDAGSPMYGSSGIELADLDRDGDLDVLYTNGDAFDYYTCLRPYHGIQWLENRGHLNFVYHDLGRYYGAFSPRAADLDGDGDLDIVFSSFVNQWSDLRRPSVVWLENNGRQAFTPHSVDNTPTDIASLALGDLDGDGRVDIVAGGHYVPLGKPDEKFQRRSRMSLWHNAGPLLKK